jgi:ATP-dependent DNA helicase RecG
MNQQTLLETLSRLRELPREAATVEFKSNLEDSTEIGQYISALANAAALAGDDRAWLVWGVGNTNHAIKGTVFDPFTQKAEGNQPLIIWLQQMTVPRADFTFHECHHPDGKVILLEIHPARTAPIAFRNIRYIRIDSHKTKLSDHPDKEARLWAKLGQKDDWSGEIVPDATLDDLEPEALAEVRRRFTEYLLKAEPDQERHARIREDAASWDMPELNFPEKIAAAGKNILPHLGELTLVDEGMSEEEKLAIIQREFDRLYNPSHPVRNHLDTLDSVLVVRAIRVALKR